MAVLFVFLTFTLFSKHANALPAFARRYNFACNVCHTDGAAPHLTELGYMFRRMAFHLPGQLGDEQADDQGMKVTNHSAIGVNVAYQYAANSSSGTTATVENGINVPEVELWPLIGGFFGNWGAWSEVDATPPTNSGGGLDIPMADVRYAYGTPDLFYNFRAGMIASEGYGASDQWIDDGNIPLMDILTPYKNQDTIATPLGAMNVPEMGFEAGVNYKQSHFTFGYYDGYTDQAIGQAAGANSGLVAATLKQNDQGMRDVKFQLDQFVGNLGEITAAYYHGSIPLTLLGDNSQPWLDNYNQERLYLTAYAIPNKLDIVAGASWAQNQYVTASTTPTGTFSSQGGFLGAFYYATPHLVLAARADKFYFNSAQSATGGSLQVSMPFGNRILIFHYNTLVSALSDAPDGAGGVYFPQGRTNDIGLDLRFLL